MLEYPFSSEYLLQNKRAIKRELLAQKDLLERRVSIVSGSTIGELKNMLELFLLDRGIKPVFNVGEYGRYFEEVVFERAALEAFAPDFLFAHIGLHNLALPSPADSPEQVDALYESEAARLTAFLQSALGLGASVIVNNFEFPRVRVMGNYEAYGQSGSVRFISKMNLFLADYALREPNLFLNDVNYLSAWYGLERYSDPSYYNAYKYAQEPSAIPLLAHSVASIIQSLSGKNKKALFLDLDNTLWGGVVGDDGVDGLRLGTESPEGMAYLDMQTYAKKLREIGVVLGVCSKNEETMAKSGFSHPSSVLKDGDFAAFYANWNDKAGNLEAAARSLNISPDAIAFADDNPAEREIVRRAGLGIGVPELTVPERFAETVSGAGYFEVTALTQDDRARADMYAQNRARQSEAASFGDYADYLSSLEMKGYFGPFTLPRIERITQLANKTNQFNLTTRRYTPDEMRARAETPARYVTLCGRLEDKFGDNGIVSEIVGEINDGALDIELWLMSCRVFKRELEFAMFDELVALCKVRGIMAITGDYLPTAKNGIVADFYASLGFLKIAGLEDGGSRWRYSIPDKYEPKNHAIEVFHEQS